MLITARKYPRPVGLTPLTDVLAWLGVSLSGSALRDRRTCEALLQECSQQELAQEKLERMKDRQISRNNSGGPATKGWSRNSIPEVNCNATAQITEAARVC